jgi:predicted DNA-binding transcriptional regulator AlpA
MASLLSARFFCHHCQKETHFLPIQFAVALAGVSRSTMYYWMDRRWIHWRELPSRRRIICKESLSHQSVHEPQPAIAQPYGAKPAGTSAKAAAKNV